MEARDELPIEITETVDAWIAGFHHPDREWANLNELVAETAEDPETWWRAIEARIGTNLTEDEARHLWMGPIAALLLAGGQAWADRLANDARADARIAGLLANTLGFLGRASPDWRERPTAYELLGRELVSTTWIRHAQQKWGLRTQGPMRGPEVEGAKNFTPYDCDFWAWVVVDDLVREDPDEAWNVILRIVELAPDDLVLGSLGAGPLEDLLPGSWLELAEERAKTDPKFAVAFQTVRLA